MKKNHFLGMLLSAMALFTVSFMTSCEDSTDLDASVASLELSTDSIVFSQEEDSSTFDITANRDWKISIPSADQTWLSVSKSEGDSDATITVSVSATTTSRYSDITVELYNSAGTIYSKSIAITQGTVVDDTTLAHASNAANVGTTYTDLKGTVVALTAVSYVVVDETGGVLVYAGGTPSFEIGDVVTISGTTVAYGGLGQFDTTATVTKTDSVDVDFSSPTVMSGTDLDTYIAGTPYVKYVKYSGTLSESGTYVNIAIDGASSAKGSIAYAPDGLYDSSLVDAEVDVYGYLVGVSGTVYVQTAAVCIVAAGADFELPEFEEYEEEEVDLSTLPVYELTGAVKATDFTDTSAEAVENMIFGNYAFIWSGGGNSYIPTYYTTGDAIRMYGSNTLTIKTVDGSSMQSIVLELQSGYDYLSCDTGTLVDGVWTGDASSVKFTSSETSSRIISIIIDGFVGDYVAPSYTFGFSSLSDTASTTDATYTIEGIDFVVNNISYSSSYGSITVNEGGYIYNTTAVSSDIVTITLNYTSSTTGFHTAKLYAGTSANPSTEMTAKATSGSSVSYPVPAGTTHFTVASESGFFYLGSIELTTEAVADEDLDVEPEPEEEEVITPTGVTGSAQYVDWTSIGLGLDSGTALAFPYTYGDYELAISGTYSYEPKYYSTGDAARFYSNTTLTIKNPAGDSIESIVISCSDTTASKISAEGGVATDDYTYTWSGSEVSVPFAFSATTRVESISINGGEPEPVVATVVSATEFYSCSTGEIVKLENVTVDYSYNSYNYVSDANGVSVLVYDSSFTATPGQLITVYGSVTTNNGINQLISSTVESAADGGTYATAIELTMAEYVANYTDYQNQFICIKDLEVSGTTLTQGESSAVYYNRFNLVDVPTDGTCDVYGYGGYYNAIQIYPTEFDNVVAGDSGTTTPDADPASLSLTAATGDIANSSSSAKLTGTYIVDSASFYYENVYKYTTSGVDYLSIDKTNKGTIYNLTAFEGLTKVVIEYKDANYYTVYEGTSASPLTAEVTPTVDGNTCTYTISSSNSFISITQDGSAYVNAISIGFYYDSLGATSDVVTTTPDDSTNVNAEVAATSGTQYVLVESAPEDWSGVYLLSCVKSDVTYTVNGRSGTASYLGYTTDYAATDKAFARDDTFDSYAVIISKGTDGGYYIKLNDDTYIGHTSGTSMTFGTETNWTITEHDDYGFIIYSTGDSSRAISVNSSSSRFSTYAPTTNYIPANLYKLQ